MSLVPLTVPAGAMPGCMITFEGPDGSLYQAPVPDGLMQGQVFQAQLPGATFGVATPRKTKASKGKKKGTCC
eukprot:NODE_28076_length_490_cov_2.614325.p4 GENE.NODE_28076_length_490_cov_2.614325~~NODE_28076_length_490_cov_2.614325.p4  ORF type:complete len:72 (-),score=24.56 NODE_28076_length_490_cov_2.614325:156-371(-)